MGRMVHFEITAEDTERAKKFYQIFGWKIESAGMPGMDYLLADTGTGDPGLNGAIMPRTYNTQPMIGTIAVDDLDEMIKKVKDSGGSIINEKQTIPGVGDHIYAKDTEGNVFAMLQALPREQNKE